MGPVRATFPNWHVPCFCYGLIICEIVSAECHPKKFPMPSTKRPRDGSDLTPLRSFNVPWGGHGIFTIHDSCIGGHISSYFLHISFIFLLIFSYFLHIFCIFFLHLKFPNSPPIYWPGTWKNSKLSSLYNLWDLGDFQVLVHTCFPFLLWPRNLLDCKRRMPTGEIFDAFNEEAQRGIRPYLITELQCSPGRAKNFSESDGPCIREHIISCIFFLFLNSELFRLFSLWDKKDFQVEVQQVTIHTDSLNLFTQNKHVA